MAKNLLVQLTVAELKRATAIKQKIEQLEKDLAEILRIPEPMTLGGMLRRRKAIHTSARRKVTAAVKKRWSKNKE